MVDMSDTGIGSSMTGLEGMQTDGIGGVDGGQGSAQDELKQLEALFAAVLQAVEGSKSGGQAQAGDGSSAFNTPSTDPAPSASPSVGGAGATGGISPVQVGVEKDASPSALGGVSATSGGSGPNDTVITNTSNHDEKIGEFLNGGSTTTPSAEIELKPGQTGDLRYQNGQGGFDAEADSSGKYQPTASRLEFYADKNGVNNDDVSYIDGDNAAVSVNDGHGRSAGESKAIAGNAPSDIVTKDSGGLPTVAGWYDGSSQTMQKGGAYMASELGGTGSAYVHPDDDRNGAGQNPMTMAQDSQQTYHATFGNA